MVLFKYGSYDKCTYFSGLSPKRLFEVQQGPDKGVCMAHSQSPLSIRQTLLDRSYGILPSPERTGVKNVYPHRGTPEDISCSEDDSFIKGYIFNTKLSQY